MRAKKINYIKAAWRVFNLSFREKQYDIIHAYYGHSGLIARLQFKYPVITTFRGSDLLSLKDGIIGRFIVHLVDAAVVMTEEMKRVSKRNDVYIIPFGINTEIFQPKPQNLARKELNLPLNKKLVLFPWNPARPEKRFDIIQEALEQLGEKYDVAITTVFNKSPQTVANYMNACDVMTVASDHEGSPMSVREALACFLPVVSVDVGDVAKIIKNVENCYLTKQNAKDIAQKIEMVFEAQNHKEKSSTGYHALDASQSAKKIIKLYQNNTY